MREFAEVNAGAFDARKLRLLAGFGWNAVCFTGSVKEVPSDVGLKVYRAAVVSTDPVKNARKALENADVVIASGDSEGFYREAGECPEVDLIQDPELQAKNDAIDCPSSGLDDVIVKSMRENNIAYLLDYGSVLDSRGMRRAIILGRMRYNVRLCLKYGVKVATASCAKNSHGTRGPHDLASVGQLLGLNRGECLKTVSESPLSVIRKAADRSNPNVITKGVEVVEWGGQGKQPKRKHGWY